MGIGALFWGALLVFVFAPLTMGARFSHLLQLETERMQAFVADAEATDQKSVTLHYESDALPLLIFGMLVRDGCIEYLPPGWKCALTTQQQKQYEFAVIWQKHWQACKQSEESKQELSMHERQSRFSYARSLIEKRTLTAEQLTKLLPQVLPCKFFDQELPTPFFEALTSIQLTFHGGDADQPPESTRGEL